MKIFLLGYMGSGKSTIGKRLSERLKMNFVDFDSYIEEETGRSIAEIFENDGEEQFRQLEHDYLKKIIDMDNIVIALGGGTPCYHNNIELINKNGISVFISVSAEKLAQRLLKVKNKRPLIRNLNKKELRPFIEANLEERLPIYQKAHYIISTESYDEKQITEYIMKKIYPE